MLWLPVVTLPGIFAIEGQPRLAPGGVDDAVRCHRRERDQLAVCIEADRAAG
jgi:hypothetical protein